MLHSGLDPNLAPAVESRPSEMIFTTCPTPQQSQILRIGDPDTNIIDAVLPQTSHEMNTVGHSVPVTHHSHSPVTHLQAQSENYDPSLDTIPLEGAFSPGMIHNMP